MYEIKRQFNAVFSFRIAYHSKEERLQNVTDEKKSSNALNEIKGHCKNEVWINSDRIKYADQFLLTKLDEIVTGL